MGQDGDAYFAVELPSKLPGRSCKVTTVAEAFELLRPKEAMGLFNPTRQGEWFFIPVKGKVPDIIDCEFFGGEGDSEKMSTPDECYVELPIDDPDSNIHTVQCDRFRIHKGVLYVQDPIMTHTDHDSESARGWYTFARNTAVRSVSIRGVD